MKSSRLLVQAALVTLLGTFAVLTKPRPASAMPLSGSCIPGGPCCTCDPFGASCEDGPQLNADCIEFCDEEFVTACTDNDFDDCGIETAYIQCGV